MARITGMHTAGLPIGTIIPIGRDGNPPPKTLLLGQTVSRITYAKLFAEIGTTFGIGDGSTTFALPPDGVFVRGKDVGGGLDPDKTSRTAYTAGTWTNAGTIVTVNTSNILTINSAADMANICIGMSITGSGIPSTTFVSAKLTSNTIQISNNATASATLGIGAVTFSKSAVGSYAGSYQGHAFTSHNHTLGVTSAGGGTPGTYGATAGPQSFVGGYIGNAGAGSDTRPSNFLALHCIVYE